MLPGDADANFRSFAEYLLQNDHSLRSSLITLKPRVEGYTKSVSLKYEPSWEPLTTPSGPVHRSVCARFELRG